MQQQDPQSIPSVAIAAQERASIMANSEPPQDNDDDDDLEFLGCSPADLRMVTMPLNSRPGPNDTGPPPVPDPWYFELKEEIEGMCLVATTWFEAIGNHIYTRQMHEDIEEFQFKMTKYLTALEYPKPASETPLLDEFGNVRTTKEEFWEHLKNEYDVLRRMTDNMRMRTAPKRVRRTPSGDEPVRLGVIAVQLEPLTSSQAVGSTSHRAPTEGVARDAADQEQLSVQLTGSGSQAWAAVTEHPMQMMIQAFQAAAQSSAEDVATPAATSSSPQQCTAID